MRKIFIFSALALLLLAGAGCKTTGDENAGESDAGIKYDAEIIDMNFYALIQEYCNIFVIKRNQPKVYKDLNDCLKIETKKAEDGYDKCVKNPANFNLTSASEGQSNEERCHDTLLNSYEMLIEYNK